MPTATATGWTATHHEPHVVRVDVRMKRRADWEQWFLLSSDRHHDNPKADHELELIHLREAVERDAGIIDNGDLFCAMQGKYDKRANKDMVRPEHQNGRYLDSLVDTAADFYGPFTPNFITIGKGNHETAIEKRHETCLTSRLVERLNNQHGGNVIPGGYAGWVWFCFKDNTFMQTRRLWRDHGYGGGGPVTKDVIQANRRAVYLPDADLVMSGHTHDHWVLPISRERIDNEGRRYTDEQTHIKTPTYKQAWTPAGGFEKERGHVPKPLGAVWLRFCWRRKKLDCDVVWAK